MRIALVVVFLALIPALLGRAGATPRSPHAHAIARTVSATDVAQRTVSVEPRTSAPAAPVAAETTASSVSLHQHVGDDASGQHGRSRSGDAVAGQVALIDSSSVNQSTASEGTRTRSTDSEGTNEASHGHGHSSSDSG